LVTEPQRERDGLKGKAGEAIPFPSGKKGTPRKGGKKESSCRPRRRKKRRTAGNPIYRRETSTLEPVKGKENRNPVFLIHEKKKRHVSQEKREPSEKLHVQRRRRKKYVDPFQARKRGRDHPEREKWRS